ncbi:MAG TPA: RAMP superfamily CRISPR-associated protein [Thermoanaerobaculia bacterium]
MPERTASYELALASPAGIFTGLGVAGLVDRLTVRDAAGLPVVPGSTVKGRLRFHAERLLRSGGAPAPHWLHDPGGPACKRLAAACTVCRLFGNGAVAGQLRVGDAALAEPCRGLFAALLAADANPVVHRDVEVRPGLAVGRRSRTAVADHLFFDETLPAELAFRGTLVAGTALADGELAFLRWTGAVVDAIGARKAAGRGMLAGGVRIADAWQ